MGRGDTQGFDSVSPAACGAGPEATAPMASAVFFPCPGGAGSWPLPCPSPSGKQRGRGESGWCSDMTSTHGLGRGNAAPGGHCHEAPSSPALLAVSGPRGGAAKACRGGSGFRCRGESGWCSDWTSTPGAWRHAGVQFPLSGVLIFACERRLMGSRCFLFHH